ncbi:LacI family DNA-binding transcriptional regulator [Nakamurella alba]|uniref:LacI family DNA-binding transcriptional regulator n=1 Tax=Nakamurella alba TaxID=2665158 RepID=UPI002AC352FB|nr:LacI family DNA-binding transcriptional regulator [Nakamurella alba]
MGKRPTLAAVAARAQVSVSTASLAFSGSGPVSESTRERVLAAAKELDYAGPDPRARSLRRGKSGIVAVAMEETVRYAFRDPVMIAFLDGIAAEIAAAELALLLVPEIGHGPATVETASMDAAILIGCSPVVMESVEIARRRSLPVVALGTPPSPELPAVTLDDRAASTALARHLADLGHSRVAVVGLEFDGSKHRGPLTPAKEAAATVQVSLDRLHGVREVYPDVPVFVTGGSLVEEGWHAGRALLGLPAGITSPPSVPDTGGLDLFPADGSVELVPRPREHRPTAVIAQSDLLAAGVIRAAEELGIAVPQDLSVVGFDGIRIDTVIPHDLTTMVQPATDQGRAAARMALDLLDGVVPADVHFRSTFHQGATTAPVSS